MIRIYEMTATFGKLEHEVLRLQPGLNVMEAPNEWGKSTWCAFLMAMLYGLDTRAKSTKTALADKEQYAPWSGSPMAGRIDLHWQGRDITIERSTRGRIPLGTFRAYDTRTGLEVPELDASNCGSLLLGVERSVFRRSCLIRQSDMPVTGDEALRRRLNALVTTGDETEDADRLERQLRELRNRCRYNRSGLLPQAEEQKSSLEGKIEELEQLEGAARKLKQRLGEVKAWLRELENHRDTLAYAKAEADAMRVAEAEDARDRAEKHLTELETLCSSLPSAEEAEKKLRELRTFQQDWEEMQKEQGELPKKPERPEPPVPFRGKSMESCEERLGEDTLRYELLKRTKPWLAFLLVGGAFLLLLVPAVILCEYVAAAFCLIAGSALVIPGLRKKNAWQREAEALAEKYGSEDPEQWQKELQGYRRNVEAYEKQLSEYRAARADLDIRETFLKKQRQSLCGSQTPENVTGIWQRVSQRHEEYRQACREFQKAEKYCTTLQAMAKPVRAPAMADMLAYTETETEKLIAEARAEQQRLENRLGQYQGRMESMGDLAALRRSLEAVQKEIHDLENTFASLNLALETLNQAKLELQRKFAPRIAKRAQELLEEMTGGRYERMTIGEDFSLLAGTCGEDTLREALWRSDGTVDQLYLALRLAVAEALTPEAPLILDDAFVRFDDARLRAALNILQKEEKDKQIILFTCQSREKRILQ